MNATRNSSLYAPIPAFKASRPQQPSSSPRTTGPFTGQLAVRPAVLLQVQPDPTATGT